MGRARIGCALAAFLSACTPQSNSTPHPPVGPGEPTSSASSPAVVAAPPGPTLPIFATEPRDVACATDGIRRQPDALADLDRDGQLDRPSVIREGSDFVIRLHRIPGFATEGEWRVRGDYVEVGTTRCRGTTNGDLWLHVGVALDPKGNHWANSLYHLESGRLVAIAEGIKQSNLFIDTDGDGCVDPIVIDDIGARVRRGTQWESLDAKMSGLEFIGAQVGYGQEEAVDLDGDGAVDLVSTTDKGISIIDPKTWKPRWTRPGHITAVAIGVWRGKRILSFLDNETLRILDTDKAHTELASFKAASYWALIPDVDPVGDGSVLAIKTLESAFIGPRAPFTVHELSLELATPFDDAVTRLGPVPLAGTDKTSLVGVRIAERGSPMIAFPGSRAKYDLVTLSADGKDPKAFFSTEASGNLSVSAKLVDLDGDGRYEILVNQDTGFSSCDMKSSGSQAKVFLVDGQGKMLWSDKDRSEVFDSGPSRGIRASSRLLDLGGNRGIRIRAGTSEWYLLAKSAKTPTEIPPCLE